jgi:titin
VFAVVLVGMLCLLLLARPAHADAFTVTNTGDSGKGTLRQAIETANGREGADTIKFAIPGDGVKTISPRSALPRITDPVIIDGYSQRGASENTKAVGGNAALKIELSGATAGDANGLKIEALNSVVKGLVINRWRVNGIEVSGPKAKGNRVEGNYVGTDASGVKDLGNGKDDGVGVRIADAPNNTVGGTRAGARNVISGNGNLLQGGVEISKPGATGNKVLGNYIGTDASGTKALGNLRGGVAIQDGAANNTVGGSSPAARNILSGNHGEGFFIDTRDGNVPKDNKLQGNYIGTDRTGKKALGNRSSGVFIRIGSGNLIGGTEAGARNVISGNSGSGVSIGDDGNTVRGNYIGTDRSGVPRLGNDFNGVSIFDAGNNTIGGTQSGAGNLISGNVRAGVSVKYPINANRNSILSNSILSNGGLGIDLSAGFALQEDGPTPNDPGDEDEGTNGLQNFPDLASATTSSSGTTIEGTLNSTPNETFIIQFFSSPSADPSGFGEGEEFVGQKEVTTDAEGNASFSFTTQEAIPEGQVVTATATSDIGSTSEFSKAVPVS